MDRPQELGISVNFAKRAKFDAFAPLFGDDEQLSFTELLDSMSYDANEYLDQFAGHDGEHVPVMPVACSSVTRSTQRKRSYESRKLVRLARSMQNEMDTLAKQIKALEAKVDYLKHRAGIPDEQSISQQSINNTMLREVLRNQQYLIAGLKSTIGRDTSEHALSPVSTTIHLGRDPVRRREALQAMRYQKIHDGRQFMEKRTQFNCPFTPFSEATKFQDEHGDVFAASFDNYPLNLAKSVKQVYDAVLFNWFNLEMCITALFGDVMAREEDDTGDESASHHRLVFSNRDKNDVETNTVVFAEYTQGSEENQHSLESYDDEAVFVCDFVDSDDLYPYRPQDRVRNDVTGIITIKLVNAPSSDIASSNSKMRSGETAAGSKPMVVLTRWVQWKLHSPEFEIPEEQLVKLMEELSRASTALLNAVCTTIKTTAAL